MKNALLTTLTVAVLSAFAPRAEAGGFYRISDRCDRSDYYRPRGCDSYYAPTYYRAYGSYRSYRPDYYCSSYRRPTYVVRDTCSSSHRGYYTAPRFSISFGF